MNAINNERFLELHTNAGIRKTMKDGAQDLLLYGINKIQTDLLREAYRELLELVIVIIKRQHLKNYVVPNLQHVIVHNGWPK